MKNGEWVAEFEQAFAEFVGARYAIALCNGTATLHTALRSCGAGPGQVVAVPPLTMSSTSLAVLHAGAVPQYVDIDPDTWVMQPPPPGMIAMPVALYGLNLGSEWYDNARESDAVIVDNAQTLGVHHPAARFTSYSFQASKILPLGEGGMLVTNDEPSAIAARRFSSLGYPMRATQPRIDPAEIKSPTYARHLEVGWNYRMSDLVAQEGLRCLSGTSSTPVQRELLAREMAAAQYEEIVRGVPWLRRQTIPPGWRHDWWTYAIAADTPERAVALADGIVKHGGKRPYAAWRLSYHEPALWSVPRETPHCPAAERLQRRLLQLQTSRVDHARRNARALSAAIDDLGA